MTREQLKEYLHNPLLVQMTVDRERVRESIKKLTVAAKTCKDFGLTEAERMINDKREEYQKTKEACNNLLENTYNITWQNAMIIYQHTNCTDREIDELPATITAKF